MENTSGQGKHATVPPEVDRWNWGAFFLNWIWGLAHNTPLALLTFLPCVGIFMPFVLGLKGSAWAWQNKRWESVEQFRRSQRGWGLAGLALLLFALLGAIGGFFAVAYSLKQSDIYQLCYAELSRDATARRILGTPIETGMVQGSTRSSASSGDAEISFAVRGPKAKGKVYCEGHKELGKWRVDRMELEVEGAPRRVPLIAPSGSSPRLPVAPGEPANG